MRGIKFRAIPNKNFMINENQKNTLNSIAYYTKGEFYDDTFIYGYLADGYIIGKTIEAGEEYFVPSYWVPVEKETIGQYTGLKDKNGNEIFEGDIVSCKTTIGQFGEPLIHEQIGEIVIDKGMTGFKGKTKQIYKDEISIHDSRFLFLSSEIYEVIGNIYENKELLEVE